ncbi:MAG: ComF family protein [Bacteroidota bacterium]|jgi:ComF family protein
MSLFFWKDFVDLIFPRLCPLCRRALFDFEPCLCTICQGTLPRANFHLRAEDNELTSKLRGLYPVHRAMAFLRFTKKGNSQALLHLLKYKNKPELAEDLGRLYGLSLTRSGYLNQWDIIVPVPLHALKKQRRGYNQSEQFALGLSRSLGIPAEELLLRIKNTPTQTRKSRLERQSNVDEVFALKSGKKVTGKRVLLVDDVLTTGATLGACARVLWADGANLVDLATIAAGGN